MNSKRIELYESPENSEAFERFVGEVFPLLLNIYSSTVDYHIRRLCMVSVIRVIRSLSRELLASVVYSSNITSLLASVVTQGKRILMGLDVNMSEDIRPCVLVYGALLITHMLIEKSPELFLKDFEREGLMTHTHVFLQKLQAMISENEEKERIDAEAKAAKLKAEKSASADSSNVDKDGDVTLDDENSSNDKNSEDANPKETSEKEEPSDKKDNGDDDDEDDEDEDDEDDDDDDDNEDDEDEDDEEDDDEDDEDDEDGENYYSSNSQRQLTIDFAMDSDGTFDLKMIPLLRLLSELCSKIDDDYTTLKASGSTTRSKHLKALDEMRVLLENSSSVNYSREQWVKVWEKLVHSLGFSGSEGENDMISSFELVSSGILDSLLSVFDPKTTGEGSDCWFAFQTVFCSTMSPFGTGERLPLTLLVKKLEEALDRSETLEILSSELTNYSFASQSKASAMAKQLRIKLISDDDSIAEPNRQLMLMAHAIATFKSINGFLKTRMEDVKGLMRALAGSGDAIPQDDFYLEFSINDEVIPHDTTIYGAVYKSLLAQTL
ncbi:unnamed protein product [Ambrosiozyma monospora]|uniref:Unnamed protein product n=1 Tax=Ambrosiozyma monospora TaxID=43982 RepID=A0ACB5TKU1_AMBMO|nr:unnamed protein product [Ambrosiozyma monospora]